MLLSGGLGWWPPGGSELAETGRPLRVRRLTAEDDGRWLTGPVGRPGRAGSPTWTRGSRPRLLASPAMTRRDRRRGGAHSASRGSSGPARDAGDSAGAGDGGDSAGPAPPSRRGGSSRRAARAAAHWGGRRRGCRHHRPRLPGAHDRWKAGRAGGRGGPARGPKLWLRPGGRVIVGGRALVAVGTGYAYVQYRFHQVSRSRWSICGRHRPASPSTRPIGSRPPVPA